MLEFPDLALMAVDLTLQSFNLLLVVVNLLLMVPSEGSQLLFLFLPVRKYRRRSFLPMLHPATPT